MEEQRFLCGVCEGKKEKYKHLSGQFLDLVVQNENQCVLHKCE